MPHRPADPPIPLPAPRRRDRRQRGAEQPPTRSKAPDEIDIFHDRQVGVPIERLERLAPDEQTLVTIRQRERANAQPHAELDRARRQRGRVERETKTARTDPWIAVGRLDGLPPAGRKPCVSVQKQQPASARDRGAGVHLARAASRRLEPHDLRMRRAKRRQQSGILRRRNNDDLVARRIEPAHGASKRLIVPVNRNDDADQQAKDNEDLTPNPQIQPGNLVSLAGLSHSGGETKQDGADAK